jgi:hypothetical protein
MGNHGRPKQEGKLNMKNRKSVFTVTVLALAFSLVPGTEAAQRLEGGPVHQSSTARGNASSEAGAQFGMPGNILPVASISFAPVGLTFGQTARLNLVNMDVANGITVSCRFIDASGVTLAQSVITVSLGKIASVDFKRGDPLPASLPNCSELKCERKLTSSLTESRATVSAAVWRYSTMIAAQRRYTWVVQAPKND